MLSVGWYHKPIPEEGLAQTVFHISGRLVRLGFVAVACSTGCNTYGSRFRLFVWTERLEIWALCHVPAVVLQRLLLADWLAHSAWRRHSTSARYLCHALPTPCAKFEFLRRESA